MALAKIRGHGSGSSSCSASAKTAPVCCYKLCGINIDKGVTSAASVAHRVNVKYAW